MQRWIPHIFSCAFLSGCVTRGKVVPANISNFVVEKLWHYSDILQFQSNFMRYIEYFSFSYIIVRKIDWLSTLRESRKYIDSWDKETMVLDTWLMKFNPIQLISFGLESYAWWSSMLAGIYDRKEISRIWKTSPCR